MKITVKKKLGNSLLEVDVEEKDDRDALSKALFFTQPDYCGLCKKTNIVWSANKSSGDKGTFTYIKRTCLDCKASSTAGEYKTGGLFWKKWEIYAPKDSGAKNTEESLENEINPEDLNF